MDRLASYFSIINLPYSRIFAAFAIVGTLSRYLEWDRLFITFKLDVVHARF